MLTDNQKSASQLKAEKELLELFNKELIFDSLLTLVIVRQSKNPVERLNPQTENLYDSFILRGIELAKTYFQET